VGNLAYREALVDTAARAADAHALIGLEPGALALDHLDVDDHGVARPEVGNFLVGGQLGDLLLLELFQQVHGCSPEAEPRAGRSGGRGQNGWGGFYWKESALSPAFAAGAASAGPEVGPARLRQPLGLLTPPGRDLAVVSGQQHLRDRDPLEQLRP